MRGKRPAILASIMPKKSKAKLTDLKPKKDVKGGGTKILSSPILQKPFSPPPVPTPGH